MDKAQAKRVARVGLAQPSQPRAAKLQYKVPGKGPGRPREAQSPAARGPRGPGGPEMRSFWRSFWRLFWR